MTTFVTSSIVDPCVVTHGTQSLLGGKRKPSYDVYYWWIGKYYGKKRGRRKEGNNEKERKKLDSNTTDDNICSSQITKKKSFSISAVENIQKWSTVNVHVPVFISKLSK